MPKCKINGLNTETDHNRTAFVYAKAKHEWRKITMNEENSSIKMVLPNWFSIISEIGKVIYSLQPFIVVYRPLLRMASRAVKGIHSVLPPNTKYTNAFLWTIQLTQWPKNQHKQWEYVSLSPMILTFWLSFRQLNC